jgi:methyl-accepting chemotaxis protein
VEIVQNVESLVASVSGTMEAQAGMTSEITGNMEEAAKEAREAKQRLAESSLVSTEIARDAAGVNAVTQSLAEANKTFVAEAQQLAAMADRLSSTVARFRMPAGVRE